MPSRQATRTIQAAECVGLSLPFNDSVGGCDANNDERAREIESQSHAYTLDRMLGGSEPRSRRDSIHTSQWARDIVCEDILNNE